MNFFALSSVLVFLSNILMAGFLFKTAREEKIPKLWGFLCLSVALWGGAGYGFSTVQNKPDALIWWQIGYIGGIITPVLFFHFVCEFITVKMKELKAFLVASYLLAVFFLVLDLFFPEIFLGDLRYVYNEFYYIDWPAKRSTIWLIFYIFFYWILLGGAFLLLLHEFKNSVGLRRNQLKYFILGSIIGWLGPEGTYFTTFHIDIYPYSNFLIAIYPLIFTYAIIKYRLMDIEVVVTRTTIFVIIYSLALGIPFYVGYASKNWVLSTTIAVALAQVSHGFYRHLRSRAEDLLLSQQRHYQGVLLQAARGMSKVHDVDKLVKLIVYIVKKTVNINYAAIFLYEPSERLYKLKAIRNSGKLHQVVSIPVHHYFIGYIKKLKKPLFYDELPDFIKEALNIPFEISLIVPSFMKDEPLGFLLLGEKKNEKTYTDDDLNVFRILAHEAGLAIENARLTSNLQSEHGVLKKTMEQLSETQNQLIQTEKMAAVGRLASGIAHEIKNPLAIILQGVEFLKGEPAFSKGEPKEVLHEINESVLRANNIIVKLLKFSRSAALSTGSINLVELLDNTLSLIDTKARHAGVGMIRNIPEQMVKVQGDPNMLQQVFFNLCSNAIDAMEKGGELTLKLDLNETNAIVEVIDTGSGIPADIQKKIFEPFFTTKELDKGTGLGLSIVRLILEKHHGTINVESAVGCGTKFIVRLPLDYS